MDSPFIGTSAPKGRFPMPMRERTGRMVDPPVGYRAEQCATGPQGPESSLPRRHFSSCCFSAPMVRFQLLKDRGAPVSPNSIARCSLSLI